MDSAMRDMDQLREADNSRGRRLGLYVMAGTLSVAAVFAVGLMRGPTTPPPDRSLDPLVELALTPPEPRPPTQAADEVRPETLSFPATLTESDDPLVEATIRNAEAEHAALLGAPPPHVEPRTGAELPAARVATLEHSRLSQVAKHDPLVARALPSERPAALVPAGAEGTYTLQVVSYESRAQARDFSANLRARGHRAFVAEADVPGRGRYFRVRIGPFDSRAEAKAYQARFEQDEHMHTILVDNRERH